MVKALLDHGVLVTLFDRAPAGFITECSCEVYEHVVVESLREFNRGGWVLGQMSHNRAVTLCCHPSILPDGSDSLRAMADLMEKCLAPLHCGTQHGLVHAVAVAVGVAPGLGEFGSQADAHSDQVGGHGDHLETHL